MRLRPVVSPCRTWLRIYLGEQLVHEAWCERWGREEIRMTVVRITNQLAKEVA